ncbi:MAG: cysteine hydrolase family protein [Betaproteobacteria bacterium]
MKVVRGIEVLETLGELVAPEHCAILVIDVQNDETSPNGAMARRGVDIGYMSRILPPLRALLDRARERGVRIVYTVSTKSSDATFETGTTLRFIARKRRIATWDFKVEGTWGNRVAEELSPRPGERQIVKFHSSAFVGTPLDQLLRGNGIRTGIVVGTATEGCVEATVRSLQDHGYYPVIVSDCVTSRHEVLHEAALTVMRARWDVVTAAELLDVWAKD